MAVADRIGAGIAGVAALLTAAGVNVGQGEVDGATAAVVGVVGGVGVAYAIFKNWFTQLVNPSEPEPPAE